MTWLSALFSSDEAAADSVAFCGIIATATVCGIAIALVAMGKPFGFVDFGGCVAGIITAAGGVKVFRERFGGPH